MKIALLFALLSSLAASQARAISVPRAVASEVPLIKSPLATARGTELSAQEEFFEKKIRPIFAASCQRCHNPRSKVAGLDLTTAEAFQRGGDSGPVINKEKPEESRLLKVTGYDGEVKMPPSGKLKDQEIAALTEWVKIGAPWPGSVTPVASAVTPVASEGRSKNPSARSFSEEEKGFWAYQPLKNVAPPQAPTQIKDEAWAQSPIDRFILRKLEEKNLKPAPPADKLTLLRRATFDLTGLPPTENEMRDFLADQSPDAFNKVVERLLASPRYGERWGDGAADEKVPAEGRNDGQRQRRRQVCRAGVHTAFTRTDTRGTDRCGKSVGREPGREDQVPRCARVCRGWRAAQGAKAGCRSGLRYPVRASGLRQNH